MQVRNFNGKETKRIMTKLFTNEKETDRAIKAAVDQANKVKGPATHCARCGCKPDE